MDINGAIVMHPLSPQLVRRLAERDGEPDEQIRGPKEDQTTDRPLAKCPSPGQTILMPCLVVLIALVFPRLVLFCTWLFSDYLHRAYQTALWPLLGFIFMPLTTLAYAWAMNSNGSVSGGFFVVVLIAALVDLGVWGGSSRAQRRRGA